jgi:threonine/homoserine/homoserine lactone efflux protein
MSPQLFEGLVFGFAVAMPFGPISLICIRRALGEGIGFAIASGLGAATAHGVFSVLSRAWSDALGAVLVEYHAPIRLASAAVMVVFGLTVIGKRSAARPVAGAHDLLAAYGSTLVLALLNPMTILPYLAAASGFAEGAPFYSRGSLFVVAGVMVGAMSWYLALSSATALCRQWVSGIAAGRLNLAAGTMLIGLGGGIATGWL